MLLSARGHHPLLRLLLLKFVAPLTGLSPVSWHSIVTCSLSTRSSESRPIDACTMRLSTMQSSQRLKVLLCYPAGDPDGAEAHEIIALQHDVIWSGSDRLQSPFYAGVEQGAREADLCVAVLSRSGFKGRNETYLSIGIALGLHTSIVLVGAQLDAPRFLRELPFLSLVALREFPSALDEVRFLSPIPRPNSELIWSASDPTHAQRENAFNVERDYFEGQLEDQVAGLFRSLHVQVREQEKSPNAPPVVGPDLVIWEDALLREFGLPLPVEVLSRITNSKSQMDRNKVLLKASGAQTLLVVSGEATRPSSWSDGSDLVLTVSFTDLRDASERRGLTGAMRELLARSNDAKR